jgi:putative phosphoesterase
MPEDAVPYDVVDARRIGFVADTHCRQADGSDLPVEVLEAFAGVDLIVHLGDMGEKGVLDRLATVAPVLATRNTRADPTEEGGRVAMATRVLEAGGLKIGAMFELGIEGVEFDMASGKTAFNGVSAAAVSQVKFGRNVDIVAHGGTHKESSEEHDGVLFFNPGSPTLHATRRKEGKLGTVAILDLTGAKPRVSLVELERHTG